MMMMKKVVVAHVYDVTNSESEKTNAAILRINRFFKDGIGVGGIFHSAIQVYGDIEWSFGFCQHGTGVFSCQPCSNPMYTYRESIILGETSYAPLVVNQTLRELRALWPGDSYDLLSRNCNHFCNAFCEMLDVPKLPAWVNRFANAGDAAMEVAEATTVKLHQAKSEIGKVSKVAFKVLSSARSKAQAITQHPSPPSRDAVVTVRKRGIKHFNKIGAKTSVASSSSPEDARNNESLSKYKADASRIRAAPQSNQQ